MFVEHGFEGTTLDMIAEAADISRRTFFHYFESKDAIFAAWDEMILQATRDAIGAQPGGGTPFGIVRGGLKQLMSVYSTDEAVTIDRLLRSSPALQARKFTSCVQQEGAVYEALAERFPDPEIRFSLRLAAIVGMGVMRLALEKLREAPSSGTALAEHFDQSFTLMEASIAG